MRWFLPLLAAALLTLIASFAPIGSTGAADSALSPVDRVVVPRVDCERPGTLRLRRFEDRSARLECAGRVLVRVSVPG